MIWLQLAAGLVGLVNAVIEFLRNRQLIEAGKAIQITNDLSRISQVLKDALEAKRRATSDADYRQRLRDKYGRGDGDDQH